MPKFRSRPKVGKAIMGVAALLLATAPAEGQAGSPLVTGERILPARGGAVLWARNSTRDTVWVDSVHVSKCANILRNGCGSLEVGVAVPPGETRDLLRLHPAVPADAFGYGWSLDWHTRADSSTTRRRRGEPPLVRT